MKYNGVTFEAIVATPGCGKSYLCDRYPEKFVDVDEVRLKCKYFVPENITREELEKTKGERPFARRGNADEYISDLYKKLDEYVKEGKILICAPHPEAIEYLTKHNIKFAFVYQNKDMKYELTRRLIERGNPRKIVDDIEQKFEEYYQKNSNENQSVLHYEFGKDEYLEEILRKFECEF